MYYSGDEGKEKECISSYFLYPITISWLSEKSNMCQPCADKPDDLEGARFSLNLLFFFAGKIVTIKVYCNFSDDVLSCKNTNHRCVASIKVPFVST